MNSKNLVTPGSESSTVKKISSKINSLQVMRAFAAIAVMLFHGSGLMRKELGYTYLYDIFNVGFLGVDIFFVLSGFIIYYTATNMTFTIGGFLKKRFLRVYPIYLVVTLGLIFLNLMAPSAGESYKMTHK